MANAGTTAVAWIALVLGAAGVGLALRSGGRGGAGREAEGDADLLDRQSLENRIADVEKRLEASEAKAAELAERTARAERLAGEASGQAARAADLAKAASGGPAALVEPSAAATQEDRERKAAADALLASIREGKVPEGEVFDTFQRARELGILDEAVAEAEKYAAAHPDDPDAQVDLSVACVSKLMQVPDGIERGAWAQKSINACDAALRIQPEHWGAQYMKAVNLSQWPAFAGRQPEAIRGFERLVEQQERSPAEPKFASTYFHLGNTYRAAGNVEKAREAYRRGLERFPDDPQLKGQLELLDKK